MADTPTTRGAYRKQGLGDRSAAWGLASGLNGVFDSMDEAIHGFNGVSLATVNYTLSSTNYTTNEVRQRFHRFTNGGISANATITVPATQNWWLISNAVSGFDLVVSNGSNSVTIDDGLTALVATDGTNVYEFPMFSTLVAPDPGSNGIVVRTALGATVARTLTGPAAGITVTAGDGVSANPTLALANDLSAVEGLASNGIAVRTATDTWAVRTVAGTANEITVTNGDGVSGNPTLSLPTALTFTGKTVTGGTFNATTLQQGSVTVLESGTWTPVLAGASVAGSHTYSTQAGRYYRTGDHVYVTSRIGLSSKDAAMAGAVRITGLPFTAIGGSAANFCVALDLINSITPTAGTEMITAAAIAGAAYIEFQEQNFGGNSANLDSAAIATGSAIIASGSYVRA